MNSLPVSVPAQLPAIPQPYVEDLKVGDTVVWEDTFSYLYTLAACFFHRDFNPVHWNWKRARKTKFGRTIVHAITVWARISRHLAKSYPGIAWIRFEADMLGPVFHGETVTFTAKVTHVEGNKAHVSVCVTVNGQDAFRTTSKISSRKKS